MPTRRPLILYVDGEVGDLRRYSSLLDGRYRIIPCRDGRTAWHIACTLRPDLVITDCCLERVNGFELARLFRSDVRYLDIPILLTCRTAKLPAQTQTLYDQLLVKPLDREQLLATVIELLARSGGHTALVHSG